MGRTITNESYVADVRRRVVDISTRMLNGSLPFLDGALELASLHHDAAVDERDRDFLIFAGIASEVDDLPIGRARQFWITEALIAHQSKIDAATEWAERIGRAACVSLIDRFQQRGSP